MSAAVSRTLSALRSAAALLGGAFAPDATSRVRLRARLVAAAVSGLLFSLAYVGPALPEVALVAPAVFLLLAFPRRSSQGDPDGPASQTASRHDPAAPSTPPQAGTDAPAASSARPRPGVTGAAGLDKAPQMSRPPSGNVGPWFDRPAALTGAVFGLALGAPSLAWIGEVTWPGCAGVVLFFAVSFAALAALVSLLVQRTRLPLAVVAPPVWVAVELVRAHIFTGFPWLFLGHAFARRLALVQIADLGGVYAVSFVAALWNASLADLARRVRGADLRAGGWKALRPFRGVAFAAAVLAVTALYGAARLASIETREGPRLVLVQGNIYTPRAAEGDKASAEVDREIWRVQRRLSREALGFPPDDGQRDEDGPPDEDGPSASAPGAGDTPKRRAPVGELLVWSESMIPGYYNDIADLDGMIWNARLEVLLAELEVPLLAGSNATGLHPDVPHEGPPPAGRVDYNSALLLDTKAKIVYRYDKMHLVPFGEYIPLARLPIFSALTPYAADDPGYMHGDAAQPLMTWPLPAASAAGAAEGPKRQDTQEAGESYRFGILICYEDVFPELARRAARLGADFLMNLSSESWFTGSSEIPQHFDISRFRAIETRLPLVRCCNVGVTAFIDPAGRVVDMLEGSDRPESARSWLRGRVPLARGGRRPTVYTMLGDAFAWLCAAAAAAMAVVVVVRERRRKRALHN